MYRIGCCIPGSSKDGKETPLQLLENGSAFLLKSGYDYVECSVGMILNLKEEELQQAANYKIEVCNCFIPSSLPLSGDTVAFAAIEEYLDKAMEWMHRIGVAIVVFGSGAARRIPDHFSRETSHQQMRHFLELCNQYGEKHQITVAIEPLNRKETNQILTVADGFAWVQEMKLPRVQLLADAYHVYCEQEPLSILKEAETALRHIHVAEPYRRTYPGQEGGVYLKEFAEMLKKTTYCGRITVECGFQDFCTESILACQFLKELFQP